MKLIRQKKIISAFLGVALLLILAQSIILKFYGRRGDRSARYARCSDIPPIDFSYAAIPFQKYIQAAKPALFEAEQVEVSFSTPSKSTGIVSEYFDFFKDPNQLWKVKVEGFLNCWQPKETISSEKIKIFFPRLIEKKTDSFNVVMQVLEKNFTGQQLAYGFSDAEIRRDISVAAATDIFSQYQSTWIEAVTPNSFTWKGVLKNTPFESGSVTIFFGRHGDR